MEVADRICSFVQFTATLAEHGVEVIVADLLQFLELLRQVQMLFDRGSAVKCSRRKLPLDLGVASATCTAILFLNLELFLDALTKTVLLVASANVAATAEDAMSHGQDLAARYLVQRIHLFNASISQKYLITRQWHLVRSYQLFLLLSERLGIYCSP